MYYYKNIDETGFYISSSPIIADGIIEITESEYLIGAQDDGTDG